MDAFIARQPNGLLCRYSYVFGCVTDYNMTEEDYIHLCSKNAEYDIEHLLDSNKQPFTLVEECFYPLNVSVDEFEHILKAVRLPKEKCKHIQP